MSNWAFTNEDFQGQANILKDSILNCLFNDDANTLANSSLFVFVFAIIIPYSLNNSSNADSIFSVCCVPVEVDVATSFSSSPSGFNHSSSTAFKSS